MSQASETAQVKSSRLEADIQGGSLDGWNG